MCVRHSMNSRCSSVVFVDLVSAGSQPLKVNSAPGRCEVSPVSCRPLESVPSPPSSRRKAGRACPGVRCVSHRVMDMGVDADSPQPSLTSLLSWASDPYVGYGSSRAHLFFKEEEKSFVYLQWGYPPRLQCLFLPFWAGAAWTQIGSASCGPEPGTGRYTQIEGSMVNDKGDNQSLPRKGRVLGRQIFQTSEFSEWNNKRQVLVQGTSPPWDLDSNSPFPSRPQCFSPSDGQNQDKESASLRTCHGL